MKYKIILIAIFSIALTISCKEKNQTMTKSSGIELSNLDTSFSPAMDFYQFANGGWLKKNPLPSDKSRYATFDELNEKNILQLKDIIDEALNSNPPNGSVNEKIKFFYQTGMDTFKINNLGSEPIKPLLARIDKINSTKDLQNFIEEQTNNGNEYIFVMYPAADKKNSQLNIAQLTQGNQGLPDKTYYFDQGENAQKLRQNYIIHIQKMLELTGVDEKIAQNASQQIFELEKQLANICLDRVQLRDEELTYNKMNIDQVNKLMNNFDFKHYFLAIGVENPGEVNVQTPQFFKSLDKLLKTVNIETWKWLLKWNVISENASYLSDNFVNEHFDFYGAKLSGKKQLRPRWKRVLGVVDNSLSEALGQVYVAKYFPAPSKERMEKLVENLRQAFKQRINNLDWMSDSTKIKAIEKLEAITVKIGYPDKWRDYSNLEIKNDSYFQNVQNARKFEFEFMKNKINKPVDKSEWYMPPQMVNAYYDPSNNEIVFPAGILQPPFFFADADDAVNYGAIGVVIGHEMTHGFDDIGSLFDKDGNMISWWTKQDREKFTEKTKKLVEMFNLVVIIDTIKANGQLTLGENIADNGGLNIALNAYKNTNEFKANASIDGFSPLQRFFLAYAHLWAENMTNEKIIQQTKTDEHSLGINRTNISIRNISDFHDAFGIKQGDKMYLAPADRINIW